MMVNCCDDRAKCDSSGLFSADVWGRRLQQDYEAILCQMSARNLRNQINIGGAREERNVGKCTVGVCGIK